MKNNYKLYLLVLALFTSSILKAATAELIFLYTVNDPNNTSVDFEIINKSTGLSVIKKSNIAYLKSTGIVTAPSSTILKIVVYKTGTSTVITSWDNLVLDDNAFKIMHLYGTPSSRNNVLFTAYKVASTGFIKYNLINSTPGMETIDVIVKQTNTVIANDFEYTEKLFSFDDEFAAGDVTLNMTKFTDNTAILNAYALPGSTLAGKFIYLFTAGTSMENDMYMLKIDGSVTKLNRIPTGLLFSGYETAKAKMFPNPAAEDITFEFNQASSKTILLYNSMGNLVLSQPVLGTTSTLNISELAPGVYNVQVRADNQIIETGKFIKK